jgi:hypothetical protein
MRKRLELRLQLPQEWWFQAQPVDLAQLVDLSQPVRTFQMAHRSFCR